MSSGPQRLRECNIWQEVELLGLQRLVEIEENRAAPSSSLSPGFKVPSTPSP